MVWVLVAVLALALIAVSFLLWRATVRLFQFDQLFQAIVDPMQEYRDELSRIATAEGLLHDHPEVIAFHRANMTMLAMIESAVISVRETRPQKKPQGLPPQVV